MIGRSVAPQSASTFAEQLRDYVADAARSRGKLKKELAREFGLRPDRLSHLQSGQRRPSHQEVLAIAGGLRLDERATNRFLAAAGFGPLGPHELDHSSTAALVGRLSEPERAVGHIEAEQDQEALSQAWDHYVRVRIHNKVREWDDAARLNRRGEELYWDLRALAERFRAQLCLADATSLQYLNRLSEAEAKCMEGLVWAADVANERFRVMLLSRLGSIKRLQSDYEEADRRYTEAQVVIDEWERADTSSSTPRDAMAAWRAHWRARIQRMQGLTELFKGRPAEAMERLSPSLDHFAHGSHHDELSQVLYALGWACSLRGEFEEALSWHQQGLEHAVKHIEKSGQEDDRLLLQGHMYLGSNHLDLGDPRKARVELEQALEYAQRRQLVHYQEVGRVYRLLGKLELIEENWGRAYDHLKVALEFYSGHSERVLLAAAHNGIGDFYLVQDGPLNRQRAVDHYLKAVESARASSPPNTYYECASLLNICRARARTGLPQADLQDRGLGRAASEAEWDFEGLIAEVKRIGHLHRYRNHLARLAVVEAEFALANGDAERAKNAAADALHVGFNFSPLLLDEVQRALGRLGLPNDLLGTS